MRFELQTYPELRATVELVFGGVPVTGVTPIVQIMRISDGQFWNGTGWQGAAVSVNMTAVPDNSGAYDYLVAAGGISYADESRGYMLRIEENTNSILEHVLVHRAPEPWLELRSAFTGVGTFGEGVSVQTVNAQAIASSSFQAGAVDAAAIGTGAIDADAIATNAIDADAVATSAVGKIADGVLDEPMAAHTTGGTLGDFLTRMLALRQQNNRVVYTAWNSAGVPTTATVYIYATKADLDADTGGTGVGATGSYTVSAAFDSSLRPTSYTSGKVS